MISIFRCLGLAIGVAATCLAAERPNVLVITTGEHGPGELSSGGHPRLKTPHLDRLRGQGMDFRLMVGAPTATATRVQLLTGCHEFHSGVSHTLAGRNLPRPDRPMLPEWFRKAGYRTALIGRWGLGESLPCRPEDRGFQEVFVIGGGELGALADHWGNAATDPLMRTATGWVAKQGAALQVFADEARRFLVARAADGERFFLLLDLGAARPSGLAGAAREAALEACDRVIGELLDLLQSGGLADATLVLFTGLGGAPEGTWNAGLKGAAGSVDEGSVRVPACVRWPGKIAAGGRCESLASAMDWFATLPALCAAAPASAGAGEGRNLAAFLLGKDDLPVGGAVFSHAGGWSGDDRPERHQSVGFAVRHGGWLLSGLELFDLATDPSQRRDLFADRPEVGTRLLADYGIWWASALPALRQPVRTVAGDPRQPVIRLTASDWWPSREKPGLAGAETLATQAAARALLERLAQAEPVAETSGLWKLAIACDGHYRVTVSLVPTTAPREEIDRLGQLKPGKVHLRTGRKEIVMEVVKGATAVTLNLDLSAGGLDLEIWFDGQLPGGGMLGALFAEIERTGERKLPELELDFRTKPSP
ncbi:MAG: sulfatase-like hydrolase/transferase [Akkermansiaceae bacterium]|nr:sulfatase-like hydrolase/transferase [Akkermansiaceae bacterium]